jgi:hypothetical protein
MDLAPRYTFADSVASQYIGGWIANIAMQAHGPMGFRSAFHRCGLGMTSANAPGIRCSLVVGRRLRRRAVSTRRFVRSPQFVRRGLLGCTHQCAFFAFPIDCPAGTVTSVFTSSRRRHSAPSSLLVVRR